MHAERSSELGIEPPAAARRTTPARHAAAPAPAARPNATPATWSRFRYPQSLYKYGAVLGALALIAYSLDYLNIDVERLPGMLGRMGEVAGGLDTQSSAFLRPPGME